MSFKKVAFKKVPTASYSTQKVNAAPPKPPPPPPPPQQQQKSLRQKSFEDENQSDSNDLDKLDELFGNINTVKDKGTELDLKIQRSVKSDTFGRKKKPVISKKNYSRNNEEDGFDEDVVQEALVSTEKPLPVTVDLKKYGLVTDVRKYGLVSDDYLETSKITQELLAPLLTADVIDCSRMENATDLLFYMLKIKLKKNESKITDVKINMNGCKFISALSLFHLHSFLGESVFNSQLTQNLIGCEGISDSMIVALKTRNQNSLKDILKDNVKMGNSGKIVVIREDENKIGLIDLLNRQNTKPERGDLQFNYTKLKVDDKELNIYECVESISNIFLTERNLVILTYDRSRTSQEIKVSIIRRLLKVLTKNILPNSALILGLVNGDYKKDESDELKNIILKELNDYIEQIESSLASHLSVSSKISFQAQKCLSNSANLCEQLKAIIPQSLHFDLINTNDEKLNFLTVKDTNKNQPIEEEVLADSMKHLQSARQAVENINKSEIAELKAMKAPPGSVDMVCQAVCVLFSTKPSYDNFKRLANSTDFITKLRDYDVNSVSEYSLKQLKTYVDSPDFTVDNLKRMSNLGAVLCQWTLGIYNYSLNIQKLEESKSKKVSSQQNFSKYTKLLDYMKDETYYGFIWPMYYSDTQFSKIENKIKDIQSAIETISFKKSPYHNIQDCFKLFEENKVISSYLNEADPSLPEKYFKSEVAKGRLFAFENDNFKHIITDIQWLGEIINLLLQMKPKNELVKGSIGEMGGLWSYNELKDKLKDKINPEKISWLIHYLSNMNVISIYNDDILNEKYIISCTNLMSEPLIPLADVWFTNWKGYEYKLKFEIKCELPVDALITIFNNCLNHKTVVLFWKYGLLLRSTPFDVLFSFSSNQVKLAIRAIDPKAQLNIEKNFPKEYIQVAFMEYYLILLKVLQKYNIPYQHSKNNNLKHISIEYFNDSNIKQDDTSYDDYHVPSFDRRFFSNYFSHKHNFETNNEDNDESLVCADCGSTLKSYLEQMKNFVYLFPNFNFYPLTCSQTRHPESLGVDYDSQITNIQIDALLNPQNQNTIVFKKPMDVFDFRSAKITFIEQLSNSYSMQFELEIANNEKIIINPVKQTFQEQLSSCKDLIKLNFSKFNNQKKASPRIINSRDTFECVIENITLQSIDICFYYNMELIMSYKIDKWNTLRIVPTIRFLHNEEVVPLQDFTAYPILLSNSSLFQSSVPINSPKDLINMKLEFINETNKIFPATIVDVSDNGKFLIQPDFDSQIKPFWQSLEDESLAPCGSGEEANKVQNSQNFIYEPKTFSWIQYLHEKNAKAVPIEMFHRKNQFNPSQFKDNLAYKRQCGLMLIPGVKRVEMLKKIRNSFPFIASLLNDTDNQCRCGLVLLPTIRDERFLAYPSAKYLNNDFTIHMTCIHLKEFGQNLDVYSHMIDVKGLEIDKTLLNKETIDYIAVSSYTLYAAENPIIIPEYKELFPEMNTQENMKMLNLKARKYFLDVYQALSFFLDDNLFQQESIQVKMRPILGLIPPGKESSNDYFFLDTCYYCHICGFNPFDKVTNHIKQTKSYGQCALKFQLSQHDMDNYENHTFQLGNKFFQHFPNIKVLGIVNHKITSLVSLDSFTRLKEVMLENNGITEIPMSLWKIKNLTSIYIERNPIQYLWSEKNPEIFTSLNDQLSSLDRLEKLSLVLLPLHITDKSKRLKLPKNLKNLQIEDIPVNHLFFDLKNCSKSLTNLIFIGVKWIDIDEYGGANAIISLSSIKRKLKFIMTDKDVHEMYRHFELDPNNPLKVAEIYKINAYLFKKFQRLGDNSVQENKSQPNTSEITIGGIPKSIFQLENLVSLNLSYQAITRVPDEIKELKNLTDLILDHCILLESISEKIAGLPLKNISLSKCLSLKTPPIEIVRRGNQSIMSYMKRLSSGSVLCKRTKLMLVGLGEAGKTSLIRALSTIDNHETPTVTDGIKVEDWNIDLADQTTLTFSTWDFAGQSVYYNTHQFFLSKRAVYLLVWNVRLGADYAGLEFWLNSISVHAPGSPIIIVGTHIDQVATYQLNEDLYKLKYKSIVGFHFVSSTDRQGIDELKAKLIETALQEKYIGESIPEVWLKFEAGVKELSKSRDIVDFKDIESMAEQSGIYDPDEVLQSVRFLHDLGSLQYFENNSLKDKVVINPQWIIDMMACIVSVYETPIKEGKLKHNDISLIWKKYDPSMHTWMLKLTEEFDLTYPLTNQSLSLVPCLLPDKEPKAIGEKWLINENDHSKHSVQEFKVIYSFLYLPAGLFNRLQVRLYQYADSTIIWKKGSLLTKNKHIALITQTKPDTILIRVQGSKPENIVYVVHEVMESLINESFHGIDYDYSFPCPDCISTQVSDPCMFSSTLLRRAHELKAPFLQCQKYFHAISISEMLALMPVNGATTIDISLQCTIRDLKYLKNNLKYDLSIIYCDKDIPQTEEQKKEWINPKEVIEYVKKQNYKFWYSDDQENEKFDKITYVMKESRMVLLFLSDNFSLDEKCVQLFEYVKNILRKNYLLVEFGKTHDWMKNEKFASVCSDFRCIMQDPLRLNIKLAELIDSLDRQLNDGLKNQQSTDQKPDVFISYCWANSKEAVSRGTKKTNTSLSGLDPRDLEKFFSSNGINAWVDVNVAKSNSGLFYDIAKGMNSVRVAIICVSDEYVKSNNCVLEFRFAHFSLKIPIIKVVVGTGNEWRKHEVSFLSGSYPEISFQYDNPNAYDELLKLVKEKLEESKLVQQPSTEEQESKDLQIDNITAFQELYELTQRKFLNQLIQFSEKSNLQRVFPRLITIDLLEKDKYEELIHLGTNLLEKSVDHTVDNAENVTTNRRKLRKQKTIGTLLPCLRVLCEHEEKWHQTNCVVSLQDIISTFCPFLVRMAKLIKSGPLSSELMVFLGEEGDQLNKQIELLNENESISVVDSYNEVRRYFYNWCETTFPNDIAAFYNYIGLKRCEMQSGKILWLCESHIKETNARVLEDYLTAAPVNVVEEKNTMLEELNKLQASN